jgi:hypothetical protein
MNKIRSTFQDLARGKYIHTEINVKVKVKLSLKQAVQPHRVVRHRGYLNF